MLLLTAAALLSALLLAPGVAEAHGVVAARAVSWSWDPLVVAGIVIAAGWYAAGLVRLRRRLGGNRLLGNREAGAYSLGLLTIASALLSPIDSIAEQLFWVHMVQHMLLLIVAAPLLVSGRPAVAFLWAFGPGGRKRVGRAWIGCGLRAGVTGLMHPIVVWCLFCGAFVFWHFPVPYQWALRDETAHTFEHLSFLVTALMFWSLVVEPSGRRRLSGGTTLVFVATAAIVSGLPGALITLAPRPLYPVYADGVAAWGMTLLQDQQLAGIVMWIPGGFAYLFAVASVFMKWLNEAEGGRPRSYRRVLPAVLLLLVLPFALAGCGDGDGDGQKNGVARIGNAKRGVALIRDAGCGSCHTIPGVPDAQGMVGPPLNRIARRIYIAGMLRNTPDNMIAWLRDPQRVVPGNVMPDMGLSDEQARDVAAYLYQLR